MPHLPLPKYRCSVLGCYSPAIHNIIDKQDRPHMACDEHLNYVALKYMGKDDVLTRRT